MPPAIPQSVDTSSYDILQGIDEEWTDDMQRLVRAPTAVRAYWDQRQWMFDMDCDITWQLLLVMSKKIQQGSFDNSRLNTWCHGTLVRLLTVVLWADKLCKDVDVHSALKETTADMASHIRHQLTSRAALRTISREQGEIWVTNFYSKILDEMRIEEVSNSPEVRAAFPEAIRVTAGLPIVCWKYEAPAGATFCNEKETVMHAHEWSKRGCDCDMVPAKYKDASGHVVTTDLSIVQNDLARSFMQKGTTFRHMYVPGLETYTGNRPEEIQALDRSISNYILQSAETHEVPEYLYEDWHHTILAKLEERYEEVAAQVMEESTAQEGDNVASRAYLTQFRKQYSIITGDKAKNTYCVLCKRHLSQQIMQETSTTTTYETTNLTEAQIVAADFDFVKGEGLVTITGEEFDKLGPDDPKPPKHTLFNAGIPTFGVSLKMHKANSLRFMAKSHSTSLTQLSHWMSRAFKSTILVSEDIWRDLFMKVGIITHSSWIINSSKQVRQRMERMQAAGLRPDESGQQTYDFATMYTSMQLKAIEKKMQQYVDLVFEYQRQGGGRDKGKPKVLMIKRRGPGRWVKDTRQRDKTGTKFISATKLKRWINYLLKRLFVKVGDQVKLQGIGLPMGTSCSPFLANIVLFMYEFQFFTNEIAKVKPYQLELDLAMAKKKATSPVVRLNLLRKLSFCTRYIDDLWNPLVNKNLFQSIVQQIYPPWLKLGLEDEGTVNYLDMTIWCEHGRRHVKWHSKLYDKKAGLIAAGLRLNKFPHPDSVLSKRCKYGVITSQLHRYNTACTGDEHFLEPALDLYSAYVKKGYKPQLINQYFSRFLRRHKPQMHSNIVRQRYATFVIEKGFATWAARS